MPGFRAPDGVRLHYTDEGPRDGLPLLCLAGLTRAGTDFDFLAPHLDGVRLIRPDYRGRGQSDWADPATYTIPAEAADAVALLDHLGIERAAVLGTSRGGIIAMWLAAGSKGRLRGVCLNDVGPVIAPEGLSFIETYIGRLPRARTIVEAARDRAAAMTGFRDVPESRWYEEASRFYIETSAGLKLTYDPALREAFLAAAAASPPDLWPLFDAIDPLPLAVLRGETSDLLSRETADEMRRRRPDAVHAEVPGRGHVPFLDEPEALRAIRAWLETMT